MAEVSGEAGAVTAPTLTVVVTGPYGAGKTTFIQTLSDTAVTRAEPRAALDLDDDDPAALAMDVGRMHVDDGLDVELLGTAGHPRLDPLWAALGEGTLGVVIMVDDTRPDSFDEVADVIEQVEAASDLPWILLVNKVLPGREELSARRAHHQLRLAAEVRSVAGDARNPESARHMLVELFEAARDRLAVGVDGGAADPTAGRS